MIKGNLKDASLPGLLQFLANEANKSYRIKVERGSLHGEIIVTNGEVVSASYGLLRGDDALCEFLTWEEGVFWVERLYPRHEDDFEVNVKLKLQQELSFADQASYLLEHNVGLNTTIASSKLFGTPEWQESSKLHPLQREDFLILGWLSEGRTMRQAMREFAFDLVQATGILYRLVLTRSVEVMRAGGITDIDNDVRPPAAKGFFEAPASIKEREKPDDGVEPEVVQPAPAPVAAHAVEVGPLAVQPSEPQTIAATAAPAAPAPDQSLKSDPTLTRRTTVLPIISIDVERLMKATFTISQFGFLALKNPALDETIRHILLRVEAGTAIEQAVAEGARSPAVTLSTFRYCLERGYITNPDPVLPLTADLLLRRTEIDQYLLQRRRLTGEALRDLTESARNEGLKLPEMLIRSGFLSKEDLDTVEQEQMRFAQR